MTTTAEQLEQLLHADLERIGDRIDRQELWQELYRALTNRAWLHADHPGVHVALSWKRAEELIDELREQRGKPPLALAQTGGEGALDDTVAGLLAELGWTSRPEDTSRHDDAHLDSPENPPPTPPQDTAADAHAEAEANRRRVIRG